MNIFNGSLNIWKALLLVNSNLSFDLEFNWYSLYIWMNTFWSLRFNTFTRSNESIKLILMFFDTHIKIDRLLTTINTQHHMYLRITSWKDSCFVLMPSTRKSILINLYRWTDDGLKIVHLSKVWRGGWTANMKHIEIKLSSPFISDLWAHYDQLIFEYFKWNETSTDSRLTDGHLWLSYKFHIFLNHKNILFDTTFSGLVVKCQWAFSSVRERFFL